MYGIKCDLFLLVVKIYFEGKNVVVIERFEVFGFVKEVICDIF